MTDACMILYDVKYGNAYIDMGVDLKVHVGIVNYKGRQCYNYNIKHRKSFSEFAKIMK